MAHWAVVVAVNDYGDPSLALSGAVPDALHMCRWLLDPAGGNVPRANLFVLLHPPPPPADLHITITDPATGRVTVRHTVVPLDPTRDGVEAVLARVDQLAASDPDCDRLYFHFAGHGLATEEDLANRRSGILLKGFTPQLTQHSLYVDEIKDYLAATRFADQFILIDACRNMPAASRFRLGRFSIYPQRGSGYPTVQQFIMYATAPGAKAAQVDERGTFTAALLDGLAGRGAAKAYDDETCFPSQFVVRWNQLFAYVKEVVGAVPLPFDQVPQQDGTRGARSRPTDPELARHPPGAFADEPLRIDLDPVLAATVTDLAVYDAGVRSHPTRQVSRPLTIPIDFTLPPRRYAVEATAAGYQPTRPRWPVTVLAPTELKIVLVAGGCPSQPAGGAPALAATVSGPGAGPAPLTSASPTSSGTAPDPLRPLIAPSFDPGGFAPAAAPAGGLIPGFNPVFPPPTPLAGLYERSPIARPLYDLPSARSGLFLPGLSGIPGGGQSQPHDSAEPTPPDPQPVDESGPAGPDADPPEAAAEPAATPPAGTGQAGPAAGSGPDPTATLSFGKLDEHGYWRDPLGLRLDPLGLVEVVSAAGRVVHAGLGGFGAKAVRPGTYIVRFRTPEGAAAEHVVDLADGDVEHIPRLVPAEYRTAGLRMLVDRAEFGIDSRGALLVSERVGPMAAAELSTVLTLAAALGTYHGPDDGWGHHLRQVGLGPLALHPAADAGLLVVFGDDPPPGEPPVPWEHVRLTVDGRADGRTVTGPPRPADGTPTAAVFDVPLQPGGFRLTIRVPGRQPVTFPLVALPGRVTMMVFTRRPDRDVHVFLYMPELRPTEPFDPAELRRLELAQRAVLRGHYDLVPDPAAVAALRWSAPVAALLGGYLLLRDGQVDDAWAVADRLVEQYPQVPHGHLLLAQCLARDGPAGEASARRRAGLEHGLPLFGGGLAMVRPEVERLAESGGVTSQPSLALHRRVPGLLWTAYAPPDDEPPDDEPPDDGLAV